MKRNFHLKHPRNVIFFPAFLESTKKSRNFASNQCSWWSRIVKCCQFSRQCEKWKNGLDFSQGTILGFFWLDEMSKQKIWISTGCCWLWSIVSIDYFCCWWTFRMIVCELLLVPFSKKRQNSPESISSHWIIKLLFVFQKFFIFFKVFSPTKKKKKNFFPKLFCIKKLTEFSSSFFFVFAESKLNESR